MKIYLNEKLIIVPVETTLNQALKNLADFNLPNSHHYAVLINDEFIPRSLYSQTQMHPEDRIELIIPMQGG